MMLDLAYTVKIRARLDKDTLDQLVCLLKEFSDIFA